MIWFTSDLHFGHPNVIQYCKRPFQSVTEMNQQLVDNWNRVVHDTDTVYVLGDLALCSYQEFVPYAKQLKGNKVLIRGNHDHYSIGQYNKVGFSVFEEVKLKLAGNTCRLSHFPYALPWYKRPFAFKSELRFMDRRPPRIEGEFLLHGHTHTKKKMINNMIHVGVDAWNYRPISLKEIESLMGQYKEQNK